MGNTKINMRIKTPHNRKTTDAPLGFPVFSTMEQMANACGIPLAILKKSKKLGCMFMRRNTCDLETFIRWYFTNELTPDERENWKQRSDRANALMSELKLEEKQQSVYDSRTVEQFVGYLVRDLFFAELQQMAQEYPASLSGKTPVQIRDECNSREKRIKDNLNARLEAWKLAAAKAAKEADKEGDS